MISVEVREYLFIGGPKDGQRIAVSRSPIRVPYDPNPRCVGEATMEDAMRSYDEVAYHIVYLGEPWMHQAVFVLESMPASQVIASLVEGYKKGKP